MNRRDLLKFVGASAGLVTTLSPAIAEVPCHHPVHTSPEGGIFTIKYLGPDSCPMPDVEVKTTKGELVECQKCGIFYTEQHREVYNGQERFGRSTSLPGYNVVPAGGTWVMACLGDDVVMVDGTIVGTAYFGGTIYKLAELDREREWVHYLGGYKPKEYSVRILETNYHTVRDYRGDYEAILNHKLQVEFVGTIVVDPHNRPVNTHHYDKNLPINPSRRSGNHRLDFAGEEYKVQLPEWWVNEHKV